MKTIRTLFLLAATALALTLGTLTASAATWYVSPSGSDAAAGTNWLTAKLTIQAAVDASAASDSVLVTNGLYATGGRTIVAAGATTNRVVIDKALTVKSVNGPASTSIKGFWDPATNNGIGPAAVRGVYPGANAVLSGFTVTNAATRIYEYGGGIYSENSGVVSNCVISGNSANWGGGGGVAVGGAPHFERAGNQAGMQSLVATCGYHPTGIKWPSAGLTTPGWAAALATP